MRRIPTLRIVALDITSHPVIDQASFLIKILKEQNCQILFTINEWGLDNEGLIAEYLDKNKVLHLNWYVDDPFYEEIIMVKKYRPSSFRIDFVSDKDYLKKMKELGYNAYFLPLGTDLSLFYPENKIPARDAVFVGNSYLNQMDELLIGVDDFLLPLTKFLATLIKSHNKDCNIDIEALIIEHLTNKKMPDTLKFEKAVFIAKHFVGYLYRKNLVTDLIKKINGFSIVGDSGWKTMTDPSRVSKVGYYSGLRELYNNSKINIDINRMVIKNGFTQRVFDSLACRCFCITSSKPIVHEFFNTTGDQKELLTFRNGEELEELIKYYLVHETERNAIAERGYRNVINAHTYDHRVNEIFRVVSEYLS